MPRVSSRRLLVGMFVLGIGVALGLGYAGTNWPLVFFLVGLAGLGIGGQQLALNYLIVGAYWSIGRHRGPESLRCPCLRINA